MIALVVYAMLAALVLASSFVLLQRGITPQLPWISVVQEYLYMKGMRSVWQSRIDCVEFDETLIYKPKLGACHFRNPEFDTTLNFFPEGRSTGPKPAGQGIAVIGDSHAMGWGVQDEETFAAELQRISNRPVYNLAVSSYGTLRELHRLDKAGLWDKIDTVILQYCDNDIDENKVGRLNDADHNRQLFETITKGQTGSGGLFKVLGKAYGRTFSAPFSSMKKKKARLKDFTPHHAALSGILAQYPQLKDKRVLVFYSNEHGKRFSAFPVGKDRQLSHVEYLELDLARDDYFRLDDHLTPAGHAKVAKQLFSKIQGKERP